MEYQLYQLHKQTKLETESTIKVVPELQTGSLPPAFVHLSSSSTVAPLVNDKYLYPYSS